ncbi:MAG: L-serine ammonia-lyase, iron-sulfur-dependent, subunit alpha [Chloroflexota bacterium]
MESIRELFKIGNGPSSSHTMGPRKAAGQFKARANGAKSFRATLYGSLAATGEGHLTDKAIIDELAPMAVEIIWLPAVYLDYHPNGMKFEALSESGETLDEWTVFSVGGGKIEDGTQQAVTSDDIYPLTLTSEILPWCQSNGKTLWEYVETVEGPGIWDYLTEIFAVMSATVEAGLEHEGTLPGKLHLPRKASSYFVKAKSYNGTLKRRSLAFAFALAVTEENAAGGKIVTAPTCGSSGVLPAVLYLLKNYFEFPEARILRALATAGLIGNIIKEHASISGAKVGCQGEIGAACAMASAAASQVFGGTPHQIEYAAEMGLEHHLGLTCDPIAGLVQIPCIERNAFAAARALDSATYANLSDGRHFVSFDKIVKTMNQTGHDLPSVYKETSEGGLAID